MLLLHDLRSRFHRISVHKILAAILWTMLGTTLRTMLGTMLMDGAMVRAMYVLMQTCAPQRGLRRVGGHDLTPAPTQCVGRTVQAHGKAPKLHFMICKIIFPPACTQKGNTEIYKGEQIFSDFKN